MRHVIFPIVGLSMILYVLFEMDRTAKVLGASWVGLGILYYAILAYRTKRPVALEM